MSYRPVSWTEADPREDPLVLGGSELLASSEVHWRLNSLLREYQREGVRFMWERLARGAGGILCDDMGLGKTVQVIALLSAVFGKNGERRDRELIRDLKLDDRLVEPALVICPSSLLSHWAAELDRWGYFCHLKYHGQDRAATFAQASYGRVEIVLTSFGMAREFYRELNTVAWQLVVVDECHKIKEKNSAITLALKSLSCLKRVGLTGTALQNNYEELWCLLDWANPGCLGSLEHFKSEFSLPMVRGFRQDATSDELTNARKKQEKFNALKQHWMIRRTKASEISDQLPTKFDHVIFCGLSDFQQEVFRFLLALPEIKAVLTAYESCHCGKKRPRHLCCDKPDQTASASQAMLLQTIQVFLKAANHPALLLPDNTNSVVQAELGEEICRGVVQKFPELRESNFLNLSNPRYSGKMDVLTGLLAHLESEGAKVLLFSYSTSVLNIIETFIQSKGYSYCRLDGSTRVGARQEMVNNFNQDQGTFIFLLSTKAGGLGLNITGANTVVIFDPNWNPSHDLQAEDRAYRLGQTRDVKVFRLISAGCIEEVVYLRQLYKQQLAANTVDGSTAKRFFKAVHGDKKRQGELFGIRNLLRVTSNINRSGITEDIEKRYKDIEKNIHRKTKVSISVQNFELNAPLEDPFGIEQDLENEVELEDEKYNPGETVDTSRTIETPEVRFVYGRTPEEIKLKYFVNICQDLGLSKEDLAKKVMEKSWLEKLEMIRKLHSSDKQSLEILDICKQEYIHLSSVQSQQRFSLPDSDSAMTSVSAKTIWTGETVREVISSKTKVDNTKESQNSTSVTSVDDAQIFLSEEKNDSQISDPEIHIHPFVQRPLKPAPEEIYVKKRRTQYESDQRSLFSQSSTKSELDEIFPDFKSEKLKNNQNKKRLIDEKKTNEYLVETIDDIFG